MPGNFEFLHIKRRTAGSSNELSFDVLEHKSVKADEKTQRNAKIPKAPKPSQGSYHGVTGTATLSGQAEVEKRKRARRSRRLRLKVLGGVAIAALVAVGVYVGVKYYESQSDINARIVALVDRLAEVDETLAEADSMMRDPLTVSQADRSRVTSAMPKLSTELNRITIDAQSLLDLSVDERSEIVIGQITKTAQTRNNMIAVAKETLDFAAEANAQIDRATNAWNNVISADQLAREATNIANTASTPEMTSKTLEMTREARDRFSRALSEFQNMKTVYRIDLADQEAYLAKKIEAMDKSIATSEALLAGNRSAAAAANDAYNDADEEAVLLAADLPASIDDIVRERFVKIIADYKARYADARIRTVEADAVIREYLGR